MRSYAKSNKKKDMEIKIKRILFNIKFKFRKNCFSFFQFSHKPIKIHKVTQDE